MDLDILDKKLIKELEEDCRLPAKSLAKKFGVTRKTITRRITSLKQKGIIKSYTILVDYPRIGYQFHILFSLKVQSDKVQSVINKVEKFDQIHWIDHLTGKYDLVLIGLFQGSYSLLQTSPYRCSNKKEIDTN